MITQFNRISIYVLFCFTVINSTSAQSPHGWRGPNRDGIYPETGLLKTWHREGPELLWETMDAGKEYFCPINVML